MEEVVKRRGGGLVTQSLILFQECHIQSPTCKFQCSDPAGSEKLIETSFREEVEFIANWVIFLL